jgi:protein-S-isoprenylcysteine O-methyltransferase Ste14
VVPSDSLAAHPSSTHAEGLLAPTVAGAPDIAGSRLFELRRWIHPVLFTAAVGVGLFAGGPSRGAALPGAALLLGHLALRLWCARHIRGAARVHARKAQERKVLVTGGPFGLVRNPLYLANTAGIAGACLLVAPPWFGAVAAVASLAWYRGVVRWEESVLARLYPEYPEYCRLVPRFAPSLLRPAGLPRTEERGDYPWTRVVRRERGAVALVLLVVVLALLRAALG